MAWAWDIPKFRNWASVFWTPFLYILYLILYIYVLLRLGLYQMASREGLLVAKGGFNISSITYP